MEQRKIYSSRRQSPGKTFDSPKYPAYVCHVRRHCPGSFYFWNQSRSRLFMNGVGTLLFIALTKGKAPAYLGSSFAFLAPAGIVISQMGYEYALGGFVVVGFCGCILAFIIYKFGSSWIDIVLPPAAMGPVVALIGLELSGSAASNAGLLDEVINPKM